MSHEKKSLSDKGSQTIDAKKFFALERKKINFLQDSQKYRFICECYSNS